MTVLSKAICRFNAVPIKIPIIFFTDIEEIITQFVWKYRRPQQQKLFWERIKLGGIMLPECRIHYKATVIKIVWYGHKKRPIEQRSSKLTHTYVANWSKTRIRIYNVEKTASSINGVGKTRKQAHEKMLNVTNYYRNANKNHSELPPHICHNGYHQNVYY